MINFVKSKNILILYIAHHTPPMSTMYSSTKFAINGLMQSLAQDLRYEGKIDNIRLTTVFPYFINTRLDVIQAVKLRYFNIFFFNFMILFEICLFLFFCLDFLH